MSLLQLRNAMKTVLKAGVKDFAEVYTHGGRISFDELGRNAFKAPCAVIAPLSVRRTEEPGNQHVVDLVWGCYLIAKDTGELSRNDWGLMLLECALGVIKPSQRWDDDDAHMITELRADNLFEPRVDKLGLSLWAITWAQGYDVNVFDEDTLDDFLTYRSDWDLAVADEVIDAQDAVDLEAP